MRPDDTTRRGIVRRAFLARMGQAAAVLPLAVLGGGVLSQLGDDAGSTAAPTSTPRPRHDDHPEAPDAAVLAFLGPITVGTAVGAWSIAEIHGVFRGGLPFVLADATGRRVQVDLLGHDATSPPGVAATTAGQLYVVNAGRGDRFTPPELVEAVQALARQLAAREAVATLPLASMDERHRRHPGGVFVVSHATAAATVSALGATDGAPRRA